MGVERGQTQDRHTCVCYEIMFLLQSQEELLP